MSRRLVPWLLALGLTAIHPTPAAARPYQNPVIPFAEAEVADPFVLKYNGEYYLYTSGDPVMAFHSRDLVHWDKLGPVLSSTPGAWNETDIWAPEVVYRNGKFLMYYTGARKGGDWRAGEMSRRVGVAVGDSPAGPFKDSGHPVTPGWAIDGHVYTDTQGQDWLFYSSLQEPRHPGAGIAVDRLVAWDQAEGAPVMCLQGSEEWEDKDADPGNGSLRYTNEGPTVTERDGKLYLFYSGGSWDRPTYAVGYATANSPKGPWEKVTPPLLRATPLVDGPGHDALVKAPNGLDDIHFYHARTQPFLDPWNRAPFADRLVWNGDRPSLTQPSPALQAAPEQADFLDLFDTDGKPSAGWTAGSENFVVGGGVLQGSGPRARLEPARQTDGPYVFEVNLRLKNDSSAGVCLGHQVLLLDGPKRVLRINDRSLLSFPKEFRADAFHQLILIENGGISAWLDGVPCGTVAPGTGFAPSLWVETGQAEFDGVALTSGYQDSFRAAVAPSGWEGEGGAFVSTAEGWVQGATGLAWRVKGPRRDRYEMSATLQPRDTSAPLVAHAGASDGKWWAGLVAARAADGEMLLAGFDKGIWPYARFRVWPVKGGVAGDPLEVGLPRGFRYDAFHTVRVQRNGDDFTFFLDGREILAARFSIGVGQAGVFSQGVATTFSHASYKALVSQQNLLLDGDFETEQWDGLRPA